MPKLALLFPGQGVQTVGMAKELADHYPEAGQVFVEADRILGYSLSRLCFEGPQERLDQTEVTQPAILVASTAIGRVLTARGITPQAAAGLSLGEYSALVAAGAVSFEEVLLLVTTRARLMQGAVPEGKGMMMAVLGKEQAMVAEACRQASSFGIVDIANYNCPGQLAISGERRAVEQAGQLLRSAGAKVIPLAVSVPSHSRLMREIAEEFRRHVAKIHWGRPAFPVISNVTAEPVTETEIPDLLVRQLYSPVRWEQSLRWLADQDYGMIEVGPGKSLTSLVKKTTPGRLLGNAGNIKGIDALLAQVGG